MRLILAVVTLQLLCRLSYQTFFSPKNFLPEVINSIVEAERADQLEHSPASVFLAPGMGQADSHQQHRQDSRGHGMARPVSSVRDRIQQQQHPLKQQHQQQQQLQQHHQQQQNPRQPLFTRKTKRVLGPQFFRDYEEEEGEYIEEVVDCMTVATNPDEKWVYRSTGNSKACGLYVVAEPEYLVEVTVEELDVDCNTGLVMLFDGWELNGHTFPVVEDHELSMKERSHYICNGKVSKKVLLSSQNAALVSYKIPIPGQGFTVSIRFVKNPDPCNILMSDVAGVFTMSNRGQARNCSLTTLLFPANLQLMSIHVGEVLRQRRNNGVGILTQCSKRGRRDFLELGGASELDSSKLLTSETLCGFKSRPVKKSLTVLCGSSTVRLVSSGNYDNSVTIFVKAAEEADMDFNTNMIMTCPDF